MRKALTTFVVLAVILVVFFVVLEYTGDNAVDTGEVNDETIEASAGAAVSRW